MKGSEFHDRRHKVDNVVDHKPTTGATGDNIVVIDPTTKLPVKDSGTSLASIIGGINIQGSWDAAANVPILASGVGTTGEGYIVSVSGSTNLDGITDWKVDDVVWFDGVASVWRKIDNTQDIHAIGGALHSPDTLANIGTKMSNLGNNEVLTSTGVGALQGEAKNSAFNKDFGIITGSVLDGKFPWARGSAETIGNTPPGSPIDGAYYLIHSAPTGIWAGKPGQLAHYTTLGGWTYIVEDKLYSWIAKDTTNIYFSNPASLSWQILWSIISHTNLKDVTPNAHHTQLHTLTSHTSKNHDELTGITADQHHNAPTELRQAIGYYVSDVRGTTEVLGADGSKYNSYSTIDEAITKGVTNNDDTIVIYIDTRKNTSIYNATIPIGQKVSLNGSNPILTTSGYIDTIIMNDASGLNIDNISAQKIKQSADSGFVNKTLYIEESYIGRFYNSDETSFPNEINITLLDTLGDTNTETDLKNMGVRVHGKMINIITNTIVNFDTLDMNKNKITNITAIKAPDTSSIGIEASTGQNTYSQLGDNAGVNVHEFRDSVGNVIAKINSIGDLTLEGLNANEFIKTDSTKKLVSTNVVIQQPDVTLIGEIPDYTNDNFGTIWNDGDRGHGIGTTNREFYIVRRGATIKYVELS